MRRFLIDTSALMLFFQDGSGAEDVESLLWKATEKQEPLLLPVVAWSELYRTILTTHGERTANEKLAQVEQLPLQLVDVDAATAKHAALLSVENGLDLLDALSLAAAIQKKATLVTASSKIGAVKDARVLLVGKGAIQAKA
jgi:predicted nucleic acid-binding protein